MPSQNTSATKAAARNDVYVSLDAGADIETVVLVGTKHIDLSVRQAGLLYECLAEVLGHVRSVDDVPLRGTDAAEHHTPPPSGVDGYAPTGREERA